MTSLDTLVPDIYNVLSEDNDHKVNEENVEATGELFKALLRTRFTKRKEKRGEEVLRFSSLGKKDRQLWYAANKPDTAEKFSSPTLFKFLYGDAIELLLLFLAREAGHDVTHLQHHVAVDGVNGSMDAVIDGIPVDAKSASPFSFKKFQEGGLAFDDPFGYIKQLSGYANALGNTENGGAFLVANKVSGEICVAPVDSMTIEGNPPGPRIAEQREIIALPSPPPRCYPLVPEGKSGNMKLGVGCSYCAFKDECYSDSNGGEGLKKYFYARGPVWLAQVVKEPKVEQA